MDEIDMDKLMVQAMSEAEFCRWLQGFCELHGSPPTDQQWGVIKQHLQLCYLKKSPLVTHPGFPPQPNWTPMVDPEGLKPICSTTTGSRVGTKAGETFYPKNETELYCAKAGGNPNDIL